MRLLWMADALRRAGLDVEEVDGWQQRGKDLPGLCSVVIGHHTATPNTTRNATSDLPSLRILRDGRSDLPGPLCQLALGRSGRFYVMASGKANHAGPGRWQDVVSSRRTIGIEAEHPGTGPWPQAQVEAYDRGVAALLHALGQGPDHYAGHREWALPRGRKPDPGGLDLDAQRARVASLLAEMSGRPAFGAGYQEEGFDVDEATLRKIIQEEVREEIRTVLGNNMGEDLDKTHYALNDVRADLREIKQRLAAAAPGT